MHQKAHRASIYRDKRELSGTITKITALYGTLMIQNVLVSSQSITSAVFDCYFIDGFTVFTRHGIKVLEIQLFKNLCSYAYATSDLLYL